MKYQLVTINKAFANFNCAKTSNAVNHYDFINTIEELKQHIKLKDHLVQRMESTNELWGIIHQTRFIDLEQLNIFISNDNAEYTDIDGLIEAYFLNHNILYNYKVKVMIRDVINTDQEPEFKHYDLQADCAENAWYDALTLASDDQILSFFEFMESNLDWNHNNKLYTIADWKNISTANPKDNPTTASNPIRYRLFDVFENGFSILLEDGSVGCIERSENDGYIYSEKYTLKLDTNDLELKNIFDLLGEGKLYREDYVTITDLHNKKVLEDTLLSLTDGKPFEHDPNLHEHFVKTVLSND
ncbi:hypothetical protein [Photobacterium leiognathi]|uniref:hypothetical protein n=1 Tax=Photobacterium leiognathi TaxID=553611 RepID=UPI002981A6A3|nr:hypothetical protein [Photobacterium leiognathi]